MQRRLWLQAAAALLILNTAARAQTAAKPSIEVWKSPTCGCCKDWVKHLQANGFAVLTHEVDEAQKNTVRRKLGLSDQYRSCHTAVVSGYVIEGHVPARDIWRLIRNRPPGLGLAVPGMPIGSPGMDTSAYGGRQDPYAVLLVQRDNRSSVYQSYP